MSECVSMSVKKGWTQQQQQLRNTCDRVDDKHNYFVVAHAHYSRNAPTHTDLHTGLLINKFIIFEKACKREKQKSNYCSVSDIVRSVRHSITIARALANLFFLFFIFFARAVFAWRQFSMIFLPNNNKILIGGVMSNYHIYIRVIWNLILHLVVFHLSSACRQCGGNLNRYRYI